MNQGKSSATITAETTRLRTVETDTLTDTCIISRLSLSSNSMGGGTESWSNIATGVACSIVRDTGLEKTAGEKLEAETMFLLHITYSTDIKAADRVVCQGVTYNVLAVLSPLSIEAVKTCKLVRHV